MVTATLKNLINRAGFDIRKTSSVTDAHLSDLSSITKAIISQARPYTMTSDARLAALCSAIEYTVQQGIPGSFVECGVWKGGSSIAAALTYASLGRSSVDLYLFDTFAGMSAPTADDVSAINGKPAASLLQEAPKSAWIWAIAPFEEVEKNILTTQYPSQHLHLVKGMVEDTIPRSAPDVISVLRIDTDWYESTRHELEHLFPRLSPGGILIIDDYGHWAGAKKAVDEYFAENSLHPFLFRIDNSGRLHIKC